MKLPKFGPDAAMAALAFLGLTFVSVGIGQVVLVETPRQFGFLCQDGAYAVEVGETCPTGAQGTLHKAGDHYILFCVCPR